MLLPGRTDTHPDPTDPVINSCIHAQIIEDLVSLGSQAVGKINEPQIGALGHYARLRQAQPCRVTPVG